MVDQLGSLVDRGTKYCGRL